jgi:cold shock CspA family protein
MTGHIFRNAYHFIPRAVGSDVPSFTPSHHHYVGLSGRITCTLTLEQPTVIGGTRHSKAGDYSQLDPFLFKGQPAIPATSLKGLISSIAEAASLSRFRVLKDEALTVRKAMQPRQFPGTIHDYVDPALRPLSQAPGLLSLAEQMFGFVVDGAKQAGSAYAGHIRPSIGIISTAPETGLYDEGEDWVRLKELSQPMKEWKDQHGNKFRNATPNFYFREKQGDSAAFVSKEDFANGKAGKYEIQGQKAYLHHLTGTDPDSHPWKMAASEEEDKATKNQQGRSITPAAERKTKARPLAKGLAFTFTLDFDNLSEEMLALLCFALRPTPAFRHKIGYGKPLGLGSVRIDPVELRFVDRAARYGTADIFADRAEPGENADAIAERAKAHAVWLTQKHPAALTALLLIGETHDFSTGGDEVQGAEAPPVLWVPLITSKFKKRGTSSAAEKDSYQWFSLNDRNDQQRLRPITAHDTSLPTLQTVSPRQGPSGTERKKTAHGGRSAGQRAQNRQDQDYAVAKGHKDVRGTIKTLNKGYGFIQPDAGGQNLFFHATALSGGLKFNALVRGETVQFDVDHSTKKAGELQAVNIRKP